MNDVPVEPSFIKLRLTGLLLIKIFPGDFHAAALVNFIPIRFAFLLLLISVFAFFKNLLKFYCLNSDRYSF